MNRREFVLGAAALGALPASSYPSAATASQPGGLATVSDGFLNLSRQFLLPDGLPDATSSADLAEIAASDSLKVACNVTAFRRPEGVILFDAGAGPNFTPGSGRLLEMLPEAGFDPTEVTDVIFTHAHPDHIWGVVDEFDDLAFPEARYHVAEVEWDFWRSEEAMASNGEARQNFVIGARNRFDAIEARTQLFKPGAEILPGIEAIAAYGHTPGHSAFVVYGDTPTMIVGDAIANDPVSFEAPGLAWGADQDMETGAKTRNMLLDRLSSETMRFIGFHLPEGGMGRVERQGSAYRFVAER